MPPARSTGKKEECPSCCTSFGVAFAANNVCCGGTVRDEPQPPVTTSFDSIKSPLTSVRFKNSPGAGLAVNPSPVPDSCCESLQYSTFVKRYLLVPDASAWNFSGNLKGNSALSNRLKRVQTRNAIRANGRSHAKTGHHKGGCCH